MVGIPAGVFFGMEKRGVARVKEMARTAFIEVAPFIEVRLMSRKVGCFLLWSVDIL